MIGPSKRVLCAASLFFISTLLQACTSEEETTTADIAPSDNQTVASSECVLPENEIETFSTASDIEFVRTPDACFDTITGFAFEPNFVEIGGLRMHYIDEGPDDGEVILMLHGQPSWSYLYREMVPVLTSAGYRVIVPDHIGMGKSDKPIDPTVHRFEQHITWTKAFISQLGLENINLFIQDWGSQFGFRVAGENPQLFSRVIAANGDLAVFLTGTNPFALPTFEVDPSLADLEAQEFFMTRSQDPIVGFQEWIDYAASNPDLSAGDVVQSGSVFNLTPEEVDAYNAPFPSLIYKGAIRAFPSMLAGIGAQNIAPFNTLGTYTNPFLVLSGELDPGLGSVENQNKWINHVPGSEDNEHERYFAGHFIQEDVGQDMAWQVADFIAETEAGDVPPGGGPLFNFRYCEILLEISATADERVREVWGTPGISFCPQEAWDALDFDAITAEFGVLATVPNGPRFFVVDNSLGSSPLGSGASQLRQYGDLTMQLFTTATIDASQLDSSAPGGRKPYIASAVARENIWSFIEGRRVYELKDPDGNRYIMQSFSRLVDPDLKLKDLENLGDRLALPTDWNFTTYVLDEPLEVPAINGIAMVLQDDFDNSYQLVDQ